MDTGTGFSFFSGSVAAADDSIYSQSPPMTDNDFDLYDHRRTSETKNTAPNDDNDTLVDKSDNPDKPKRKGMKCISAQIPCTYADCPKTFTSEEGLLVHKRYDGDHDYCKLCNLDCQDWDEWTYHVAQMSGRDRFGMTKEDYVKQRDKNQPHGGALYYDKKDAVIAAYGAKIGKLYGSPNPKRYHKYGCKFCGVTYHTEVEREKHINVAHAVDQRIECQGCGERFPRASGLIAHMERNRCPIITAAEFKGLIMHKNIINKLLQDPTLMFSLTAKDMGPYHDAARDEQTGGGVSLLSGAPDTAIKDIISLMPATPTRANVKPVKNVPFPQLVPPGKSNVASSELISSMKNLAVKSNKPWPLPDDSKAGPSGKPTAWAASDSASQLFPDAKPAPMDWEHRHNTLEEKDHKTNLLKYQFWNPAHKDYSPDRFYSVFTHKYSCPFPECGLEFEISEDCSAHITKEHELKNVRCPGCFKYFKTMYAIMAHFEAVNSKCKIHLSAKYNERLHHITGGFINAKVSPRPDFSTKEDGVRVGFLEYTSKPPQDFEKAQKNITVGTKFTRGTGLLSDGKPESGVDRWD